MKADMRTRSRIVVLVAGAVTALIIGAPRAGAHPSGLPGPGTCNYPGTGGHYWLGRLGVEFCDYPPVSHGQHYHCEWAGIPPAHQRRWLLVALAQQRSRAVSATGRGVLVMDTGTQIRDGRHCSCADLHRRRRVDGGTGTRQHRRGCVRRRHGQPRHRGRPRPHHRQRFGRAGQYWGSRATGSATDCITDTVWPQSEHNLIVNSQTRTAMGQSGELTLDQIDQMLDSAKGELPRHAVRRMAARSGRTFSATHFDIGRVWGY